jgi:uncharacterized phiE125 gp8 family phage protein
VQLIIKTPPTAEPVSLAEAKAHLRVNWSDDDALITAYAKAARSGVEAYLKAACLATTYQLKLDRFPATIELPVGPVLTADGFSIKYLDDAGDEQTLAAGKYKVSLGERAIVRPSYGNTWPSTRAELDAVTVEFVAGWPEANLPAVIKAAVLLWLGDLYSNRENTLLGTAAIKMPTGIEALLLPHVIHS